METGTMDCRQAEAALPALLEGSLPAGESVRLREHLTGCPACRRGYEEYQRDQETLARFLRTAPYLPVAGRVLERLPGRRAGHGARSRLATGANALAHTALVAVVIGALALVLRSMVSGGPGVPPMEVAQLPTVTPSVATVATNAAPDSSATVVRGATPSAIATAPPIAAVATAPTAGPTWQPAGRLTTGRESHAAIALPNGQVLVIGGRSFDRALATVERYDPATGRWDPVAPMGTARVGHTATLLADGRVLVSGGDDLSTSYPGKPPLASAEVYDPATDRWMDTAPMTTPRADHTATRLPTGQVLVVGGNGSPRGGLYLATAERFDPATGHWTPAGMMTTARTEHTATPLPDGQVLVAGGIEGYGENPFLATAERYDPTTNEWRPAASMATTRAGHAAVPLNSGQVLVAGGINRKASNHNLLASAERYDFATDQWLPVAPMAVARYQPIAVSLPGNRVLVAGAKYTGGNSRLAEVYDVTTGHWTSAGMMSTARPRATATALPNGRVLVAGGAIYSGNSVTLLDTAELYNDPPSAISPPPQPPRPSTATPRASGQTMQIVRDVVIDPSYNFSRMGNYPERAPRFSPDGRLVALLPPVAGTPFTRLVVYDVASGAERDLTPDPGARYTSFGWSPDGRSLAFVKDRPEGGRPLTSELWRIDADGGNLRKLYTADFLMGAGWSADGQYLDVGGTTFGGGLGPGNNKRVRADGSGIEDRESTPQTRTICGIREGAEGAWRMAPDGSYALCSAKTAALLQPPDGVPEGGSSLVLYDYAVQRPVVLASLSGDVRIMGVAPDSQWIAFLSMPGSRIWVVRRDGTGLREVGGEPHNLVQQGGVTWSNAGRAYFHALPTSSLNQTAGYLYELDAERGTARAVTTDWRMTDLFGVSPDGRYILLTRAGGELHLVELAPVGGNTRSVERAAIPIQGMCCLDGSPNASRARGGR